MAAGGSPRARYRERTRSEIKEIALRQLAEGGIAAIALTRIAKELELSGPALYRYFDGRDDLLGTLIGDAYRDLAAAVGATAAECAGLAPRARLAAFAGAYRAWATAQPHRFLLIAGSPLPGFTAPPETVVQSRAALGPLLPVFAGGGADAVAGPLIAEMTAWHARDEAVAAWAAEYLGPDRERDAGPAIAGAVLAWTRMHGVVSLEVEGNYGGMGHRAETLLTLETTTLADTFGLP